jgi:hypothetical protein
MTEIHPSLAELIHDEQGEHAKAQILLLVRKLQSEGIETRSIARALFRAMLEVSAELSGSWQYRFLDSVSGGIRKSLDSLDMLIDTKDGSTH